jgi:hypothetical protein
MAYFGYFYCSRLSLYFKAYIFLNSIFDCFVPLFYYYRGVALVIASHY